MFRGLGSRRHLEVCAADRGRAGGVRRPRQYAVDTADGSLVWEYETDHWVETSPAFADGVVYVGTGSGQLLGLDVATGDRVYRD